MSAGTDLLYRDDSYLLEFEATVLERRQHQAHAVFAQADGLPHDIPALLLETMRAIGGRGGGRGNLAQGGSDRVEGLPQALEAAARRVRGGPASS